MTKKHVDTSHEGIVNALRSTRYVVNSQRARLQGLSSGIDGRTDLGKRIKPQIAEVHALLASAKDRLAVALRELGDKPLEGDPE